MVDVGEDFTINLQNNEKTLTSKTKIIMPADLAGWPCGQNAIKVIVNKEQIVSLFEPESDKQKKLGRILVLSDAAHFFGATYKQLPVGKLADITFNWGTAQL